MRRMSPGSLSAVFLTIAVVHLTACQRSEPTAPSSAPPAAVAPPAASPVPADAPLAQGTASAQQAESPAVGAPERAQSVDLSVPRTVSMAQSPGLSFTIAEASIEPRSAESVRLILVVRMHNKQQQTANFADENFRLVTQDSTIQASSGLGETVDANKESMPEQVQFVVPVGAAPRALQIEYAGETIEVPLAFK